jgi:hypothetical protein
MKLPQGKISAISIWGAIQTSTEWVSIDNHNGGVNRMNYKKIKYRKRRSIDLSFVFILASLLLINLQLRPAKGANYE